MAIDGISSTVRSGDATTAASSSRVPGKSLGQDDFLKLLVTQLSAQDPMNPQKDTEFIAQMAQFTSLEQTTAMRSDLAGLRQDQQMQQANALIGRNVVIQPPKGEPVLGTVTGLNMVDGAPQIIVNNEFYPLSSLLRVAGPLNPS